MKKGLNQREFEFFTFLYTKVYSQTINFTPLVFFKFERETMQISHLKFLCNTNSALIRLGYVISELKDLNFKCLNSK